MRIGVVANLDRSWGGIYQYAVTFVSALAEVRTGDEFVLFVYEGEQVPAELDGIGFERVPLRVVGGTAGALAGRAAALLPDGVRARLRGALGHAMAPRGTRGADKAAGAAEATAGTGAGGDAAEGAGGPGATDRPSVDAAWAAFFARHGIELLLFTADSELAPVTGVPYVAAVHDIQHRLQPEFPEVSADGEFERREARIGATVAGASAVLVDSEVGREDVLACYGDSIVHEDSVRVLPFLPAAPTAAPPSARDVTRVRAVHGLPEGYLFYPAQFWPHKNHERIIEALALLGERGVRPHIAFAGTHSGELRERTYERATRRAAERGVASQVHDLGYVDDGDMAPLYAGAVALVMPTFFGPTNIPVVEAWGLGCPVITSDIRGVREQAGDAAVLVDPADAGSIAEGIGRVLADEALRDRLIEAGRRRISSYTREEFVARLSAAIEYAKGRTAPRGQ